MELVFNQINDRWEAEIKVTADFNLHIEGVREGNVSVFQRGTEMGGYAYVREATPYPSVGTVYEHDFSAILYPKYIKIACATAPSLAVVTSEGEVIQINNAPVEPEEPESDVIEYHFEIPMEQVNDEGVFLRGNVEADFSEIFNKIAKVVRENGTDYGYQISVGESDYAGLLNITVNGDKTEEIGLYASENKIEIFTDAPVYSMWGDSPVCVLTPTSVNYSRGI